MRITMSRCSGVTLIKTVTVVTWLSVFVTNDHIHFLYMIGSVNKFQQLPAIHQKGSQLLLYKQINCLIDKTSVRDLILLRVYHLFALIVAIYNEIVNRITVIGKEMLVFRFGALWSNGNCQNSFQKVFLFFDISWRSPCQPAVIMPYESMMPWLFITTINMLGIWLDAKPFLGYVIILYVVSPTTVVTDAIS